MLDAGKMIAEAKALFALQCFDSDDVEFHLRRLVDAVNTETVLTEAGERRFHTAGVYLLGNRLLLAEFLDEHRELREADIGPAIMIVGLPRTGSTKLQRLIAQDRRMDHLTLLDVALPLAFPGERDIEIRTPLIRAMERALGQPELISGHNLTIAEPEEELEIQKSHFTARNMRDHAAIPRWGELMKTADASARYHVARQFIVGNKFQRNRSGIAWILKNAYAGEHLDVIAGVLPNTKFVMTHRDPLEQLGSITSLSYKWRRFHSDAVTKRDTGAEYLHFWSDFMSGTLAAIRKIPPERLLHVAYRDVLGNPLEAIANIYEFCGLDLPPDEERAIRRYDAENEQHRHGKHSYSLEEFGLTSAEVEEAFAEYVSTHGDKI